MRNLGLIASTVALLFAVGCNESKTGAEGNISFTPDECNALGGCDFDDSIGVGGAINVNIAGIGGFSTARIGLVSDDPSVLEIVAITDVGDRPTWRATGIGPGVARISAIDSDEIEVDFLEVGVQGLIGFGMDNFIGDAVGPTSDVNYHEIWSVNANQATSFYVVPLIAGDVPTMGRYTFTPYLDQGLDAGLLDTADINNGHLYFNVPAGDYTVSFVNQATGLELDVLIQAIDAN